MRYYVQDESGYMPVNNEISNKNRKNEDDYVVFSV